MSVQVDVVAYNALIHAAASSADAGLALSLLDAMAAAGLQPDLHSYNTALHALVAARPPVEHAACLALEEPAVGARLVAVRRSSLAPTPERRPSSLQACGGLRSSPRPAPRLSTPTCNRQARREGRAEGADLIAEGGEVRARMAAAGVAEDEVACAPCRRLLLRRDNHPPARCRR